MKKVTFGISVLFLFLTACTNSNLLPNKPVKKITITRVEDGETFQLTNREAIKIFKHAFTEVEKMDGLLSIQKQDYEVTFYFENDDQKPLFMWLSEETGIAMDPRDHNTSYGLKEENVAAIQALKWEQ
jgi:hypothetical protein